MRRCLAIWRPTFQRACLIESPLGGVHPTAGGRPWSRPRLDLLRAHWVDSLFDSCTVPLM